MPQSRTKVSIPSIVLSVSLLVIAAAAQAQWQAPPLTTRETRYLRTKTENMIKAAGGPRAGDFVSQKCVVHTGGIEGTDVNCTFIYDPQFTNGKSEKMVQHMYVNVVKVKFSYLDPGMAGEIVHTFENTSMDREEFNKLSRVK